MITSEWEKTGNCAVDMVAACVTHNRAFNRAIKDIYLCPRLYVRFKDWIKRRRENQDIDIDNSKLEFDGVNILEGSALMIDPLYCSYYGT